MQQHFVAFFFSKMVVKNELYQCFMCYYKMFCPQLIQITIHIFLSNLLLVFIFSYMLLGNSSLLIYACIVYARQIEQISSIIFRPIICGVKYFDYSVSQIAPVVENRVTNGNDIDKDDFDFLTFFNLIHTFKNSFLLHFIASFK